MRPATIKLLLASSLAILGVMASGCEAKRVDIKDESNLGTADLTLQELRREVSTRDNGYDLAVSFLAGSDASSATVLEYIFLINDASAQSSPRVVRKNHNDICNDGHCRAVVGHYVDKGEAAQVTLRAGLRSSIIIRYWKDPGTVLPNGTTCEHSDCNSCGCSLCSCAGIAPPDDRMDARLAAIMNVQDLEHLHNVWISTVE